MNTDKELADKNLAEAEIKAMKIILEQLIQFDRAARRRISTWVNDKIKEARGD